MGPRVGHSKSRSGCAQCKKRRVKCDESRHPACSNCTRLDLACSFADPNALSPTTSSSSAEKSRTSTPFSSKSSNKHDYSHPGDEELPLFQLRLLHHYTTSTCASTSKEDSAKRAWAVEVPKIAYQVNYLMHAILAVSALHSAHLHTDEAKVFLPAAEHHIEKAMDLIKPHLNNLGPLNCNPLFAASGLISLYHWTRPLHQEPSVEKKLPIDSIADAMALVRGSCLVVINARVWVVNGPLAPICATREPSDPELQVSQPILNHIEWLREMCRAINVPQDSQACLEAVQQLLIVMALIFHADPKDEAEMGHVMSWCVTSDPHFLVLLRSRYLPALAILAFFCPLSQKCREDWPLGDWEFRLLEEIYLYTRGSPFHGRIADAAMMLRRELGAG